MFCSSQYCKRSLVVVIVLSCVWHLEGDLVVVKGLENQTMDVCSENSFFLRLPAGTGSTHSNRPRSSSGLASRPAGLPHAVRQKPRLHHWRPAVSLPFNEQQFPNGQYTRNRL